MAKGIKGVKGAFLLFTGFLTCPCHLPFVLPALAGLLAGTATGAFIAKNTGLLIALATAYFVGVVVYFLRWNTGRERSDPKKIENVSMKS